MSDYVHNKAVMYPIDCKVLGIKDAWELQEKYPNLILNRLAPGPFFTIEAMCKDWTCRYYLSYTLYSTYGKESGDFGRSRPLTQLEQALYEKIFKQIISDLDASKLRYVDYCYYNCCESEDYYLADDNFNEEKIFYESNDL